MDQRLGWILRLISVSISIETNFASIKWTSENPMVIQMNGFYQLFFKIFHWNVLYDQ